MILCCPQCTGENYYAVLKTSGSRILSCPRHPDRRLMDTSGRTRTCSVPVIEGGKPGQCGRAMVVGTGNANTCPNCGSLLVAKRDNGG